MAPPAATRPAARTSRQPDRPRLALSRPANRATAASGRRATVDVRSVTTGRNDTNGTAATASTAIAIATAGARSTAR